MRSHKQSSNPFNAYLEEVALYNKNELSRDEIDRLLGKFKNFNIMSYFIHPIFYTIDYKTCSYLVFSQNVWNAVEWFAEEFLEGGLDKAKDVYHKDDFKIFGERVFAENVKTIKQVPSGQHKDLIFSHTFRARHRDGHYVNFFEQSSYILCPETGLPLYAMGAFTDISLFKKDSSMYHSISLLGDNAALTTLQENYFFPDEELSVFSQREKDVLGYMAEGYSSKQIAHKLKITINTVANHRQNMMRKSNAKNVAELIAMALQQKVI